MGHDEPTRNTEQPNPLEASAPWPDDLTLHGQIGINFRAVAPYAAITVQVWGKPVYTISSDGEHTWDHDRYATEADAMRDALNRIAAPYLTRQAKERLLRDLPPAEAGEAL